MVKRQRRAPQAPPIGTGGWRRIVAAVAAGGVSALVLAGLLWTATWPLEQARSPPEAAPGAAMPSPLSSGRVAAAPAASDQSVADLLAEVDALIRQADSLQAQLDRIALPGPVPLEDPLAALPEARELAATPAAAPLPLVAPEPAAVPPPGQALRATSPEEDAPPRLALAPPPRFLPAARAATAAPAVPAQAVSPAGQRCRSIIVRVQLGEEPSHADRSFLRGGCR